MDQGLQKRIHILYSILWTIIHNSIANRICFWNLGLHYICQVPSARSTVNINKFKKNINFNYILLLAIYVGLHRKKRHMYGNTNEEFLY